MSYLHDLSRRLIAADTVSHRPCAAAMEELADELHRAGLATTLQRWEAGGGEKANLVAWAGPPEPDGLMLSGHLDIVPFEDQPGWTRDPLVLEIGEERVTGRGTSDMKVFLAQTVDALRGIDVSRLRRPVVVVFTADEEIGCLGGARVAEALPSLLSAVPVPRWCWIGEPTSGRVFHAHKGIVAFGVNVAGEGGHSSVPEAGVNAIAVAARAIACVGEAQAARRAQHSTEFEALFPEAPYTSVNFGRIHGGTASNMIAEACAFDVSYRPLPDEEPLALYEEVAAALRSLDARDWGSPQHTARIEVGQPLVAPGLLASRGSALERELRACFDDHAEGGAPFCTDGGQLTRAGVESLVCGPGDLDQAHQPDESIARAAFEQGSAAIARVVRATCEGDAPGA